MEVYLKSYNNIKEYLSETELKTLDEVVEYRTTSDAIKDVRLLRKQKGRHFKLFCKKTLKQVLKL